MDPGAGVAGRRPSGRRGKSAKIRYWSQEEYDIVGSFGCADD